MKKMWALLFLVPCLSSAALVNFTLFNTVALEESDDTTTLLDGDLVQLILDGGNLVADPADESGGVTLDDSLLSHANNPTEVGDGQVDTGTGVLLTQMTYDDSLAGSWAYVRFFDDPTPTTDNFYGQSALFQLPAADQYGNASFDFMSMVGDHMTYIVVPEPASLVMVLLAGTTALGLFIFRKPEPRL